jgi:hypothetical protein
MLLPGHRTWFRLSRHRPLGVSDPKYFRLATMTSKTITVGHATSGLSLPPYRPLLYFGSKDGVVIVLSTATGSVLATVYSPDAVDVAVTP